MKFRKKPVIVEAEQWFPGKDVAGVYRGFCDNLSLDSNYCWIKTLEGKMKVSPGDWIITGVEGERYPCKDSIFRKTYEAIEEDIKKEDPEVDQELTNEVNEMLKNKKVCNRVDGIRKNQGFYEWGLMTYKGMYWFSLTEACTPVQEYLLSLMKLEKDKNENTI